jgi:hypothetical protein
VSSHDEKRLRRPCNTRDEICHISHVDHPATFTTMTRHPVIDQDYDRHQMTAAVSRTDEFLQYTPYPDPEQYYLPDKAVMLVPAHPITCRIELGHIS